MYSRLRCALEKTLSPKRNIMKKKHYLVWSFAAALAMMTMNSCSEENSNPQKPDNSMGSDANYVGKAQDGFTAEEWYPGGELGTTENVNSGCYEDEAPAVNEQGLHDNFKTGEMFFERQYTVDNGAFKGVGPAYLRKSCLDCHPSYGHGMRQDSYAIAYGNGNGYLMAIYTPDAPGSNDGNYIGEVTGMPQTGAADPFKAPIEADKIKIQWEHVSTMESGLAMKFPADGETFDLIYPEVTIPSDAFHTNPVPSNIAVRLESTIGVIGTGLLDAIPQEEIEKQYASEAAYFKSAGMDISEHLNPKFWDAAGEKMAAGAYYSTWGTDGQFADGGEGKTGVYKAIRRFTYALTRASLQDGPGANAIWNITNVSRPDRPKLYSTKAWAKAMSEDPEVIAKIKANPQSPYYADGTDAGIKEAVYNLLLPSTNQFDNQWHKFQPEMTANNFYDFMVWHRGLAIPRARNLNDKDVQRGKKLFMEWGCASCHRPSWKTGDDNYWTPNMIAGKPLPRYKNQTIYPYSDMLQHKLYMKNDIHDSWCRTTPLWGRGLSRMCTGAEDRLHDCRARNEVEAIMWHCYSKNSHAYQSALNFYKASKTDRDAVVKFLQSI